MNHGIITEPEKVTEPDPLQDPSGGSESVSSSLGQRGFSVNNGWIKIHRKILDWEWYSDHNTFRVFFHLLLTVNHEPKKWRGVEIKSGQIVTGRQTLAQQLGLGEQTIRTALSKLKSTNEITIKSNRQYSIITIQKWKDYQEITTKLTNKQPTTNQQLTTTKEVKNVRSKEDKNKHLTSTTATAVGDETNEVIGFFKEINPSYTSLYARKPQRAAAERLIKRYGKEKLLDVVGFIGKFRGDRFCPTITTPTQLEDKWAALESYAIKLKGTLNKNKIVPI